MPAPVARGCKSSRWTAILLDGQALGNVAGGCSSGLSDGSKTPPPRVVAANM